MQVTAERDLQRHPSKNMDTQAFEASLKVNGYKDIEIKTYAPSPANGEHGHHFSVRGLVLDGTFTVIRRRTAVTYRAGEVFAVAEGCLHSEEIGPAGARVLVGRKS
jgi:quercetin dioxygenase-like cupin family protein